MNEELINRAKRAYTQWPLDITIIRELVEECEYLADEAESYGKKYRVSQMSCVRLDLKISLMRRAMRQAIETGLSNDLERRLQNAIGL